MELPVRWGVTVVLYYTTRRYTRTQPARYSIYGRFVGLCLHVFSRTVAAVDTKRGYVGMCNGRSAQQESGAALSKNSMFTAGA